MDQQETEDFVKSVVPILAVFVLSLPEVAPGQTVADLHWNK